MLTLTSVGRSQVDEFEESFSGRGPFGIKGSPIESGLDNPDWSMLTSGGDLGFQDGGLAFNHVGVDGDDLDGTFVRFVRDVGRFDSFVERIEIRGVELGVERLLDEHPDASSGISLLHRLGTSGMVVGMSLLPSPDEAIWDLGAMLSSEGLRVPKGSDVAMTIVFDAIESEVRYAFDNNVGDETPPFELGPFEVERTSLEGHNTYVQAGASGGSNRETVGVLDFWSLTELIIPGDYDDNHLLTVVDVDLLMVRVREGPFADRYDLNDDGTLDSSDVRGWVEDLKGTFLGDANLDGEFNSADLVTIFQAGEYDDGIALNSTWATGDWNADAEFDSGDLVFAFAGGGYEFGPRQAVAAVPEPSALVFLLAGTVVLMCRRRRVPRLSVRNP